MTNLAEGYRYTIYECGDPIGAAVVPPGTAHAFAAAAGSDADLLIILTPGVERFEYFRHLQRIATGAASLESILEVQDRYDNYFDDSPAWQQNLARRL